MKKLLRILLFMIAGLFAFITLWNVGVLMFPHTYEFLDAEGKANQIETRRYTFGITETRLYIEDDYHSKALSITIGETTHTFTYDADGQRMDYPKT